jgi:hypothetical protein
MAPKTLAASGASAPSQFFSGEIVSASIDRGAVALDHHRVAVDHRTTGTIALWEMNGPTIVDSSAVNTIPTNWQVVA